MRQRNGRVAMSATVGNISFSGHTAAAISRVLSRETTTGFRRGKPNAATTKKKGGREYLCERNMVLPGWKHYFSRK